MRTPAGNGLASERTRDVKGPTNLRSEDRSRPVEIDQAWVDEQLKHFAPGDMDGFVRQMRAYERADRERASRVQVGEVA